MAERSFAREVQPLRLQTGEAFAGEGILAVTRALVACRVGYVGGCRGAPIPHLMGILADANDILDDPGVHFEIGASGADADICTGDHACMGISGGPSLTLRPTGDPLCDDPVAFVDETCVACGHCGEVADAAILCPSYYRADVVQAVRPRKGAAEWAARLITAALGNAGGKALDSALRTTGSFNKDAA